MVLVASRPTPVYSQLHYMKTMTAENRLVLVSILLLLIFQTFALANEAFRDSPGFAPCFSLPGRLTCHQGYPAWRIWWIGTKRILGAGHEEPNFPAPLTQILESSGFDVERSAIYADFVVCPLTKQQPGLMQHVRVDSAKNIRIGQRH
jgi:hypothetical protein